VGHAKETTNCIFADIQVLCERLEGLDIETILKADR
jgi:hypothetical protein